MGVSRFTTKNPPPVTLASLPTTGYAFTAGNLVVYEPIVQDQHTIGVLRIQSSLAAMRQRFYLYGLIVLLILGTSSLIAFALSAQLQRRITDPIQELAITAQSSGYYAVAGAMLCLVFAAARWRALARPRILAATAAILAVVSLTACLLPSRRATRISPMEALAE